MIERLLVLERVSARGALWVGVNRLLAVPFVARAPVHHYRGRASGETLELTCAGRQIRFRPLLSRLFDEVPVAEAGASHATWSPTRLARLPGAAAAVEIHPWLATRFRAAGWTVVPQHVRWRAPVTRVPPARPSKSLRSDLKLIQRSGYEPELIIAPTREDWSEFEHNMLVPHRSARFGPDAWHASEAYLRPLRARGALLYVVQRNERVAGFAAVRTGDTLWGALAGVRDGDPELLREGALSAAYAFLARWARESGATWLDVGRTTPFRSDKLARYKAKWGFSPAPNPLSRLIALRLDATHVGLARAVGRDPFLVLGEDDLRYFAMSTPSDGPLEIDPEQSPGPRDALGHRPGRVKSGDEVITYERAGTGDRQAILDVMRPANMHRVPSPEVAELELERFFVARVGGRVVGAAGWTLLPDGRGKTTLLAVLPAFAARGIGARLQEMRLGALRDAGATTVTTNADRPTTIDWYRRRYGYRVVGTLPKLHEFGEPSIDHWTTLELDLEAWTRRR